MDKKYRIIFALSVFFIIPAIAIALSGYSYQVTIAIENNEDESTTSRAALEIDAESLVDGGYIQIDGGDIAYTEMDETTQLEIMACSLDSGTATWILDYETYPASSLTNKYLWLGNSAADRDQKWIAGDSDNCYVAHDSSLSFSGTDSFSINCDITLVGTPIAESYIIGKSGSYALLVDGTPSFIFRAYETGTTTTSQELDPNQYISNTCDKVGNIPSLFSDSSDTTYIHEEHEESCIVGMANPTLPEGLNVGTVTVCVRALDDIAPYTSWVEPALRYGSGAWDSGTKMYPNNTWGWHETIFPTDPDGGSWSIEDMHELQMRLTLNGQSFVYVSESYIEVEGTYSGSPTSIIIPATVGLEYSLTSYYINGSIGISDGSNSASGTISSLHTNTASLHLCEFDGYVNNMRVSTP